MLVRAGTRVQVGWDPERAVVLVPPAGVDPRALRDLIRDLDGTRDAVAADTRAARVGLAVPAWRALLGELVGAGLLRIVGAPDTRHASVLLHGHGPISDLLQEWLPAPGVAVSRCGNRLPEWHSDTTTPDLVVLADTLVTDPGTAAELTARRVPHLPVLLRDGTGVVGPLVLPARTSCLRCADLHRRDLDPDWPMLAAQLLGLVGWAPPATLRATAALASAQVDALLAGVRDRPPAAMGASLTVDLGATAPSRRTWHPHPDCSCGAAR